MTATPASDSRPPAARSSEAGASGADAIRKVEADLAQYRDLGLLFEAGEDHTQLWNWYFFRGREALFDRQGRVHRRVIRDFWRLQVFLGDNPRMRAGRGLTLLSGARRGERALMEGLRRTLRRTGCRELARKYPCPKVGRPRMFRTGSLRFTHRWAKHIYHLKRVNEFLGARLPQGFVTLDIGSGPGLFSSLIHQEYAGAHAVLVDLPEQLLLARYFLEKMFPGARIAGVGELSGMESISRETLARYDFVLMPWQYYGRLEAGSVDLMTSFAALGELRRHVFDYYVDAPVFRSAGYLYVSNPVQSDQMFAESDVTLLDYPLVRGEGRLYFGVSPMMVYLYTAPVPYKFFHYELPRLTPFFEYIGKISPN